MKAMLLRVGIDKGTDGALAPIFEDFTFEYVPMSERDLNSNEERTYGNTKGRAGKLLSSYFAEKIERKIKSKKMHFDPEFDTFTYGDPTSKRKSLLKLARNDLLVFYAGLTPYETTIQKEALYIIGYFTVDRVIDFSDINNNELKKYTKLYPNNAHLKRSYHTQELVIVVGQKECSKLLKKAILISTKKINKINRPYQVVSPEMERLLGISGSIQRSIPPRFIKTEKNISNLKKILDIS